MRRRRESQQRVESKSEVKSEGVSVAKAEGKRDGPGEDSDSSGTGEGGVIKTWDQMDQAEREYVRKAQRQREMMRGRVKLERGSREAIEDARNATIERVLEDYAFRGGRGREEGFKGRLEQMRERVGRLKGERGVEPWKMEELEGVGGGQGGRGEGGKRQGRKRGRGKVQEEQEKGGRTSLLQKFREHDLEKENETLALFIEGVARDL